MRAACFSQGARGECRARAGAAARGGGSWVAEAYRGSLTDTHRHRQKVGAYLKVPTVGGRFGGSRWPLSSMQRGMAVGGGGLHTCLATWR